VVRLEQQRGGVSERLVEREPGRVGVAVRADDRQAGDLGIELARERPDTRLGGEQAVRVQGQLVGQRTPPACNLTRAIAMIALTRGEFRA
jgi:hypothetical protein